MSLNIVSIQSRSREAVSCPGQVEVIQEKENMVILHQGVSGAGNQSLRPTGMRKDTVLWLAQELITMTGPYVEVSVAQL